MKKTLYKYANGMVHLARKHNLTDGTLPVENRIRLKDFQSIPKADYCPVCLGDYPYTKIARMILDGEIS